jgi:hypothetical protein
MQVLGDQEMLWNQAQSAARMSKAMKSVLLPFSGGDAQ